VDTQLRIAHVNTSIFRCVGRLFAFPENV